MSWRIFVALAIVAFVFFGDSLTSPTNTIDYNSILGLEDQKTSPIGLKKIVSDQTDRENIAILHNEMGKRTSTYSNVNTLQFEKFYVNSAKEFFGDSLAGKYRDLGEKMYELVLSTLGDNEGTITDAEMKELSKRMRGLAWEIIN